MVQKREYMGRNAKPTPMKPLAFELLPSITTEDR